VRAGRRRIRPPFEAYGFTKSFEEKHPDAVKNFMLALQDAQTWVLDPANKQKAIDLLIKYTKVDPDVAQQVYKVYFEESKGAYANIGIDEDKLKRLTAAIGVPYSDKYNNSVAAQALAK
jgi:ABC-type nitrate/sulfonate/bicarbonate transport system substrate-binding protein